MRENFGDHRGHFDGGLRNQTIRPPPTHASADQSQEIRRRHGLL